MEFIVEMFLPEPMDPEWARLLEVLKPLNAGTVAFVEVVGGPNRSATEDDNHNKKIPCMPRLSLQRRPLRMQTVLLMLRTCAGTTRR
ncbi:hypothetical protein MRX96_011650 [Rhipicephalus microplus]